ncbi:sensor histidine kinase [Flavobacterium beibuense]|uniref:Signal transduction histidine kinase, LytS n=1 Tax=Flavobacterium beibuense TaxID=657326 RepID=A0A444WG85_9FLAO|nr:histidine kinase [Flavobacterium beibuense]RYJ44815.1 Signal transduction histidine kinase, LytS [Flavobacterium beibuense]
MNKYIKSILEKKWWQELFILVFSFVLFTLNDWILIKSWRGVWSGCAYFLLLYSHAQLNRFFLLPILLKKHKPLLYILSSLALLSVFSLFLYEVATLWIYKNCFLYKSSEQKSYIFQAATLVATLICILSVTLILKFYRESKKLDSEKLLYNRAQLNSLKEQLNPHFLFNTFNTLYGISLQYPERTPDLIMHVSQLMRYQLESHETQCVPLEDEINFVSSYVELEKERLGYRCNITLNTSIDLENTYKIPPMLLICFIENAFKHGTCTSENCFVDIDINVNDDRLEFMVKNSIPKKKKNIVSTKIGLKNTKERLKLLYGTDHDLTIEENRTYTVTLKVKLKRL